MAWKNLPSTKWLSLIVTVPIIVPFRELKSGFWVRSSLLPSGHKLNMMKFRISAVFLTILTVMMLSGLNLRVSGRYLGRIERRISSDESTAVCLCEGDVFDAIQKSSGTYSEARDCVIDKLLNTGGRRFNSSAPKTSSQPIALNCLVATDVVLASTLPWQIK
jgi:hypothetical protein